MNISYNPEPGATADRFPYMSPAWSESTIQMPGGERYALSARDDIRDFLRLFADSGQRVSAPDKTFLDKAVKAFYPYGAGADEWTGLANALRTKVLNALQRMGLPGADIVMRIRREQPDELAYAMWTIGMNLHRFAPGYSTSDWKRDTFPGYYFD